MYIPQVFQNDLRNHSEPKVALFSLRADRSYWQNGQTHDITMIMSTSILLPFASVFV